MAILSLLSREREREVDKEKRRREREWIAQKNLFSFLSPLLVGSTAAAAPCDYPYFSNVSRIRKREKKKNTGEKEGGVVVGETGGGGGGGAPLSINQTEEEGREKVGLFDDDDVRQVREEKH